MSIFEIALILISAILVISVFAYSIKENSKYKKPPVDFIREFFNHFGDSSNFKR